jgi:hypothetical protein
LSKANILSADTKYIASRFWKVSSGMQQKYIISGITQVLAFHDPEAIIKQSNWRKETSIFSVL